ncbi:MAG TPA: hypothetical protein VIM69_12365 [Opitutaceae bacterium]
MNWALEHLQLAVVIVIVIGGLIKKVSALARGAAKNADRPKPQAGSRQPNRTFDPEAAERTRRVQEEIRRKIEERRHSQAPVAPPPPVTPRPAYDPFTPEALQRQNPPAIPRPVEPSRAASERALLVARRLEAAKQREEKRKAKASAREDTISIQVAPISLIPSAGPLLPTHPLREILTNPEEVRRAIILSEIIQPPVALR